MGDGRWRIGRGWDPGCQMAWQRVVGLRQPRLRKAVPNIHREARDQEQADGMHIDSPPNKCHKASRDIATGLLHIKGLLPIVRRLESMGLPWSLLLTYKKKQYIFGSM